MFAGIIEEIGIVKNIKRTSYGIVLFVYAKKIIDETMKIGDSLAVEGVCLTITNIENNIISFDVVEETLSKTNIGNLKIQDKVNLERSLRFSDRISGHFVLGHIDDIGIIRKKRIKSGILEIEISFPQNFSKYIVKKGNIAVSGISLTVVDCTSSYFSVSIIPSTLQNTTIAEKNVGDKVNLEFDIIGKYVEKMIIQKELHITT